MLVLMACTAFGGGKQTCVAVTSSWSLICFSYDWMLRKRTMTSESCCLYSRLFLSFFLPSFFVETAATAAYVRGGGG